METLSHAFSFRSVCSSRLLTDMNVRICRVCCTEQVIEAFAVYRPDGKRRHECLTCMKQRQARYNDIDWVDHDPRPKPGVNLKRVYAGKHHCWLCRKPVRDSAPYTLCKVCSSINHDRPETE